MTLQQSIHSHFFARLHKLQVLYCDGKIARGSPEHSEILALEELESLFVQNQMKRLYEVELRFLAHKTQDPISGNL